jgi:hypothetical protein
MLIMRTSKTRRLKNLNCNCNHRANSKRCTVIKQQKEINQIMTHRNIGFLQARKMVENGHKPGRRTLLSLQVLKASKGTLNLI